MLPPSHHAEIRRRFIAFVQSPGFQPYLKRLSGRPYARMFLAFVSFLTTIGIPVAIYQVFRILGHRKAYRKHLVEVAGRSIPLTAYPLMVNNSIGDEPGAVAPGLVIGSFDPKVGDDLESMSDLALKILSPESEPGVSPADSEFAEALMEDIAYQPHRRRLLPLSLTGGREVYAFDLMIVSDFLPGGRISGARLPCLAEPGPTGEIHLVPASILASAT